MENETTVNIKRLPVTERIGLFMDKLKTLDDLNAEIKGDDLKKEFHLNGYIYKAMVDLDLLDHPQQSRLYTCKWEMDDNGKTPRIYARHIAEWLAVPTLSINLKRINDKGMPLGRPSLDEEPMQAVIPHKKKVKVKPKSTGAIEKDVKVNVHVNFKITFE